MSAVNNSQTPKNGKDGKEVLPSFPSLYLQLRIVAILKAARQTSKMKIRAATIENSMYLSIIYT